VIQPSADGSPRVALDDAPRVARTAWTRLRHELTTILGDDLVAMWAHGGTIAPDGPPRGADLDTYVILKRRPDQATVQRIEETHDHIGRELDVDWDAWYVLSADARRPDAPRHAYREGRRDTSWAIRRRELEHLERHVVESDTDPYEATYAILNGSRILHAVETGHPAISKAAAGIWALAHLPARWHAAIQAANRNYAGQATAEDVELLATVMAPFVAMVRDRLPANDEPSAEALPRWSGY
jgi:hypothetical protein